MRRALTAATTCALLLVLAAPAFAAKSGEGLVGETNDKAITFFSLGLIVFFTLLVTVLSYIQGRLDRRKDERKAARARQRVGW